MKKRSWLDDIKGDDAFADYQGTTTTRQQQQQYEGQQYKDYSNAFEEDEYEYYDEYYDDDDDDDYDDDDDDDDDDEYYRDDDDDDDDDEYYRTSRFQNSKENEKPAYRSNRREHEYTRALSHNSQDDYLGDTYFRRSDVAAAASTYDPNQTLDEDVRKMLRNPELERIDPEGCIERWPEAIKDPAVILPGIAFIILYSLADSMDPALNPMVTN
eukprot:CAMPEP_0118723910 /NCGR_PEP_ID=MMETSP0800-20121206/32261_1 /TAXON_ID=210618 ORGANISM="Striatella unipunctata, Strain CCMP2910" /NCGR_SAMPLE_ID=MMETSP0800 /ASSEMBLY_ACC=CAM_ASM_000638 /LENGTH=212 /DNA_ID=CAMNT_0006632379 /DNA_START=204 /DNA_END=842 /DNA_ORIENTATION=+